MSATIKARASEPSHTKVSKTTGGAYADMADVIESELRQLLEKHGISRTTPEQRKVLAAKLHWLRRRELASGK